MVIDVTKDGKFPRYLIYDIVTLESKPVGEQLPFDKRLKTIISEIIGK